MLQEADVGDLNSSGPVRLEFVNVDYRVSLRVNGREVLATTDAQYAPDVKRLLAYRKDKPSLAVQDEPAVHLSARGQEARVEHLTLSRDVFYLNRYGWGKQELWGDPDKPIELGPEEYFVLGDNSFISGDARTWIEPNYPHTLVDLPDENLVVQNGRVPKRFLLGKAFFVYWPAGHRPWGKGRD